LSSKRSLVRWMGAVPAVVWLGLVYAPLMVLLGQALSPSAAAAGAPDIVPLVLRSAGMAALIAFAAVVLGYVPGRLLAGRTKHADLILLAVFVPLVLPDYVLYYAWSLLLSPTTYLGTVLSADATVARAVSFVTSSMVLVLWHWPIAALLIGHSMRCVDPCVLDAAAIDAGPGQTLRHVVLPMLLRPLMLAYGVCFILVMSSFTTFHLSGARTIGTELAVLYEQTYSPAAVARAAWPVLIPALVVAIAMGVRSRSLQAGTPHTEAVFAVYPRHWIILGVLMTLSVVIPGGLFVASVSSLQPFVQFVTLHGDQLMWGSIVAVAAAMTAYLTAVGVVHAGEATQSRAVGIILYAVVFIGMFMPGSLVAASLIQLGSLSWVPDWFRQGLLIVAVGQAVRFTGPVLILLILSRAAKHHRLSEMASLDGASRFRAFVHVHLPASWRLFLSAFILIVMFSLAEIPVTMILLPPGLPSFSQLLLNQMHYARDQQVIASCLVLMAFFAVLASLLVFVLRNVFAKMAVSVLILCVLTVCGCRPREGDNHARVLGMFGTTGKGQCQFIYPRGIELATDGTLYVVDKVGRIQHLKADGEFISDFSMPLVEAGKPTGLSMSPDGNLYVADTHYHRVMIFSADGRVLGDFGRMGQEDGCFIYPTDVAFSGEGRIFVSEYGGNDRISVFSDKYEFLYSFGTQGDGTGQLSRPAAMAVDRVHKLLYVADACNNRIGVYNFDGEVQRYIGTAGTEPGQLRYPYSVVLGPSGELVVCEYGNNRIQVFDTSGKTLAIYGMAGRQAGQLAYPWAVTLGAGNRAYIVDSGNNRIQVWQL
jgi:ABC-type Fe3+ transport system permease subunit/DNA-binding beta-propeller fold protein YncE